MNTRENGTRAESVRNTRNSPVGTITVSMNQTFYFLPRAAIRELRENSLSPTVAIGRADRYAARESGIDRHTAMNEKASRCFG